MSYSLVLSILSVLFILFVLFLLLRKKPADQSFVLLQNQVNEIARVLDTRLQETSRLMHQQFGASAAIVKEVTEKLVKLNETNKQVVEFADQLRSLQDILKNPKQRGNLGEYSLEATLQNVLPPNVYQMQYEFKDGMKVDAAIFYQNRIIPVDAKFSLENYIRLTESGDEHERERHERALRLDLVSRIDETAKYVRPGENTTEFAFMFIPAEALYYDLLINKIGSTVERNLIEYATREKKVVIVSPTSFLAYILTVLQGMRAEQIQKSAQEIIKRVQELGRHIAGYETHMQKLGAHLGTTVGAYNTAYKELGKIDKDVLRIGGEAAGVEARLLEKPEREEALL